MSKPEIIKPQEARDPKLGIKSSFPNPKQGIAWISLIFLANNSENSVSPFKVGSNEKLEFAPEQLQKIVSLYQRNGISDKSRLDKIQEAAKESVLLSSQVEHILVAFELFLPLAEVKFTHSDRPMSAERTGGRRFEKTFRFSSGLRQLCNLAALEEKLLLELFACWILEESIDENLREVEKEIQKQIFRLCAKTQYKLDIVDSTNPQICFNTIGLYKSLLNAETESIELNTKEKKGALRILFSALEQNLLPGLKKDKNLVSLNTSADSSDGFTRSEVEKLFEEELCFQELLHVESVQKNDYISVEPGPNKFQRPMNIIYYGVPGSGKSHMIDKSFLQEDDKKERVVFHPDYLYSNFVGQILPSVSDGKVSYSFKPGPFTKILKSAIGYPNKRHVLIIEEINRGNAAAIFGDIFQLLDRITSGESQYAIHNSDIAEYVYGDPEAVIKIPPNLYLVATMNTSDQNVYTLDTAFQRRWAMKMVPNDISVVPFANRSILDTSVTWKRFNETINNYIVNGIDGLSSSEDKRLGGFFVRDADIDASFLPENAGVFAEKVLKYLWDDAFKFDRSRIFLSADKRSLEDVIFSFEKSSGDDRWSAVLTGALCEELFLKDVESNFVESSGYE